MKNVVAFQTDTVILQRRQNIMIVYAARTQLKTLSSLHVR